MPVARTKLMIEDDILKPKPEVKLSFTGKRPEKFYKEIPRIVARVFKVHTGQIQERAYNWSKTAGDKFKIEWEIDKDLDKYSYYALEIKLEGESAQGEGKAKIIISGLLRTEYAQETIWEKSLFYEFLRMIWDRLFYINRRDMYLREGRRLIAILQEDLKKLTHTP